MNRNDKSRRILAAALAVFRTKSYHGATTKEIADAAGVSVGSLFRLFPNKEDLLMGLLAKLVDTVVPRLFAEDLDAILGGYVGAQMDQSVKAFVHGRLVLFHENKDLISVIHAESAFNPRLRDAMYTRIYAPMRCLIEKFVSLGISQGRLRAVAPGAAARYIASSILYTFLDVWYLNLDLTGDTLDAIENEFVDLIMNGIKRGT